MKPLIHFSIDGLLEQVKRFPVYFVFTVALTAYCLYCLYTDSIQACITFFLAVGIVLALLLHLWTEEWSPARKKWQLAAWIPAFLALGTDAYILNLLLEHGGQSLSEEVVMAQSAAFFALIMGVCFLSFRKERSDMPSWNFAFRLIGNITTAMAVGLLFTGGLELLYQGGCTLFGLKSNTNVIVSILILGTITTPLLLFILRMPPLQEKHDDTPTKSAFLLGVIRYLFVPLVVLYMTLLYCYSGYIAVRQELPKGMLSYLVITMMLGVILIVILLYPYLQQEERKWERKVVRWLPVLTLPLLVTMSVGIARRFSDYGMTPMRLYLATLNLWFYFVSIGLIINKSKRISWIPISMAVCLLLTTSQPYNYTRICHDVIRHRVERLFEQYPTQQPIKNYREWYKWRDRLPEENQQRAHASIEYMMKNHADEMEPWMKGTYYDFFGWEARNADPQKEKQEADTTEVQLFSYQNLDKKIPIIAGYEHFCLLDRMGTEIQLMEDSIVQICLPDSTHATCDLKELSRRTKALSDEWVILSSTDRQSSIVLQELSIYAPLTDKKDFPTKVPGNIVGYLFTHSDGEQP